MGQLNAVSVRVCESTLNEIREEVSTAWGYFARAEAIDTGFVLNMNDINNESTDKVLELIKGDVGRGEYNDVFCATLIYIYS